MKGKLLQRLKDASRSGVYRSGGDAEIVDALRVGGPRLVCIDFKGAASKKALLSRLAEALRFPGWFGGNWDALEDSLKDLPSDAGHVLVFGAYEKLPPAELQTFIEILEGAAAFWRDQDRPFFAVFVDPGAALTLQPLFRPG